MLINIPTFQNDTEIAVRFFRDSRDNVASIKTDIFNLNYI
jgi:hypothetical protein